jgi:hypothetical protein
MSKVYVVFSVCGDGDSYSSFDLEGVSFSLDGARGIVVRSEAETEWPVPRDMELVHKSMRKNNHYTFVGSRKDKSINDICGYGCFGGYIIEEMEVQEN